MRMARSGIAVLLAAVLLAAPLAAWGIPGEEPEPRDARIRASEAVNLHTTPAGEVKAARIIKFIGLNGTGPMTVRQTNAFRHSQIKWQGVKGFTNPRVEGDMLVWDDVNVDGARNLMSSAELKGDAVGELAARIPLKLEYRYWFDGERIEEPAAVTGRDGHFRFELKLTNTSSEKTEVTYTDAGGQTVTEEVESYMPLVILPYDWRFDSDVFFNLKTDPTGVVVYLPEFHNVGWSIPLFPPATEESHTIWVEADVKNFQMPNLSVSANFVFPNTNQRDTLSETQASLTELYNGVVQLNDGLGEAVTGLGSAGTADTLLYGTNAILEGLQQMADPVEGLPYARRAITGEMLPGVDQMVAGLGSPGTPDTLLYAINATTDGLNEIKTGIGSPDSADTLMYAMKAMQDGMSEMKQGIGSAATPDTLLYGVSEATGGLEEMRAGIGASAMQDTLLYAISQMEAGMERMKAGIGAAGEADTLQFAMEAMRGGLEQSRDGIGSTGTSDTLLYAMAAMQEGLNEMKAGIGDASTGDTLLYAVNEMSKGLKEMSGGCTPMDFALKFSMSTTANLRRRISLHMPEPHRSECLAWIDSGPLGLMPALQTVNDGVIRMWKGLGSEGTAGTLLYAADQVKGGLARMKEGIGAAGTPDSLLYAVARVQGGLNLMKEGIGAAGTGDTLLYAVARVQAGLDEMKAGIGSAAAGDTLLYAADQVGAGLKLMKTGIGSERTPDTLLYAMGAMNSGLSRMRDGLGSAATPDTLLYAVAQVENGLEVMRAGIGAAESPDTLLYAMAQVQFGLFRMRAGLASGNPDDPGVREGLQQISAGLGTAVAGLGGAGIPDTLIYGADQVDSGARELQAGMVRATTEGTEVMLAGLGDGLSGLNLTTAELEVIKKRGKSFNSMIGAAEDADNVMSFVFETPSAYSYVDGSSSLVALVIAVIMALSLVAFGLVWRVRSAGA